MHFDSNAPDLDPQIAIGILKRAQWHVETDKATDDMVRLAIAEPTMLNNAWSLALWRHATQKDKNNYPYWTHLETVRAGVAAMGGNEAEQVGAVLHDVVEDSAETIQSLADYGFPFEVLLIVEAVTKRPNEDNKLYIGRVITAGRSAMLVKLADLYTNTDPERLATLPDYTQERLKYKYFHAIRRIEDALNFERTISDADYDESQTYKTATYSSYTSPYSSPKGKPAVPISSPSPGVFPRDEHGNQLFLFRSIIAGDMFPDLRVVTKKTLNKDNTVTLLFSDGNLMEGPADVRVAIFDAADKAFAVKFGRAPAKHERGWNPGPAPKTGVASHKAAATNPAPAKKETILLPALPDDNLQPTIPGTYTPKVNLKRVNTTDEIVSYEDALAALWPVEDYSSDEEIAAGMAYLNDRIESCQEWESMTQDEQSAFMDATWAEFQGEPTEGMAWQT